MIILIIIAITLIVFGALFFSISRLEKDLKLSEYSTSMVKGAARGSEGYMDSPRSLERSRKIVNSKRSKF